LFNLIILLVVVAILIVRSKYFNKFKVYDYKLLQSFRKKKYDENLFVIEEEIFGEDEEPAILIN